MKEDKTMSKTNDEKLMAIAEKVQDIIDIVKDQPEEEEKEPLSDCCGASIDGFNGEIGKCRDCKEGCGIMKQEENKDWREGEMKELLVWEIKYASSIPQLRYVHRIIAKLHAKGKISTQLLTEIDRYRKAKGELLKIKTGVEG